MRVLFLTNFYPPYELGGYEQWCHEVATGLIARGHAVHVLTSQYGVGADNKPEETNITRSLHLETDIAYYRPADFFLRRKAREAANRQALRRALDDFNPDIVMVWGMWNLSHNLPYWAEEWMPDRVAYFISNYWPSDRDPHAAYWQLPTRRSVFENLKRPMRTYALAQLRREQYPPQLRFDHAVCCSEYVRNTLVQDGKLPAQAGVIYGGTDPEPFLRLSSSLQGESNLRDHTLRLLYFGRLIHDKGVHTAIEALAILNRQNRIGDVELTILGNGHPDYEDQLRNMVLREHLSDHVQFVGKVPRAEVPDWLGRSDVFLFTSIWPEPMARTMMEAMAAGLLVIGTEVGGQTEMLANGKNALTFQAEDADCLAEHITKITDDTALRQRLARAGQEMVLERFTLDRMVDEIEQYLVNVMAGVFVRQRQSG